MDQALFDREFLRKLETLSFVATHAGRTIASRVLGILPQRDVATALGRRALDAMAS